MNYDENLTYEWLRELRQKKLKLLKEDEDPDAPPDGGGVGKVDTGQGQAQGQVVMKASQKRPSEASAFGDFTFRIKNDGSLEIIEGGPSITTVDLKCGTTDKIVGNVSFNSRYANLLANTYYEASKASSYCPQPSQGYAARVVKGPAYNHIPFSQRNISNHSFGTAIDFNAARNNFERGKRGEIESYPSFITTFEQAGFDWLGDGGDGLNKSGGVHVGDDMHFQVRVGTSPDQVVDAADGSTPQAQGSSGAGANMAAGGAGVGSTGNIQSTYSTTDWYEPYKVTKGFQYFTDGEPLSESDKLLDKKEKNKKISIKNKSKHKELMKNKELLIDMLSYFGKKLKFDKPVKINFIEDSRNSNKPLGKTAYYHPEEYEITVFTTGRLLKDILRSIGHELIHHKQHCKNPFDMSNHQEGYAQKDKSMRKREKEAYLYGNILFRDWEDSYKKKHKGVS